MTTAQMLEQLETSLKRAEDGHKDVDLLVALRILYHILRQKLREEEEYGREF